MNKVFSFVLAFGAVALFVTSIAAQEDMVKLIRSENYDVCGYQTGCGEVKDMLIQVMNTQYYKEVYAHHSLADGSWVDIPAHYERSGNSVYELWHIDPDQFSNYGPYSNQFVLKYIVGGQTYWDNNNGANYILTGHSQNGPGPMLGNNINVLLRGASLYRDTIGNYLLSASIDVRNIAYAKNVQLIYTTNDWSTSTSLNANYTVESQTGWCSLISWPNAYSIERWKISSVPVTGSSIKFYISYTVNNITYYDNNYGANYNVSSQN